MKEYEAGKGYRKISIQLSSTVSSEQSIITNKLRMAAPRKIPLHAIAKLSKISQNI